MCVTGAQIQLLTDRGAEVLRTTGATNSVCGHKLSDADVQKLFTLFTAPAYDRKHVKMEMER